jgi:hypothetical protein
VGAPRNPNDSPNCPRQGDARSCGVFTCTNMMCLGFGYHLMCYKQRDMAPKRRRMAAELGYADGFGVAPYDYKFLDVSTSIEEYRTDYSYVLPKEPASMPQVLEGPDRMELDSADDVEEEDYDDDELMDSHYDDTSSEDGDDPSYAPGTDVFGLTPRDRYPSTIIPFSLIPKDDPLQIPQAKTEELWPSQFQ